MVKLSLLARKKKSSKKTKRQNHHAFRNKLLALGFLCLTLVILYFPSFLPKPVVNNNNPIKISSSLYASKNTTNDPVRILIPKADIDLRVIDAPIVNGYWQLSETTASYGLGSGHPGTKSNTVIFAHARQGLFYNLKDINLGDIVYIFTKDKWYRYKVNKITAVYPNQTEVIKPTKNEVLTLYTCTGFYDEKRLIVTALPQS